MALPTEGNDNVIPFRRPTPKSDWVAAYIRFWTESLDRLDVYVKELKRKEGRHAGKRRRR